jgi:hypothetical protein
MLVEKVKKTIINLSSIEYIELRDWFIEYDNNEWDKQIEKDIRSGKLNPLAEEALKDYRNGNYDEL